MKSNSGLDWNIKTHNKIAKKYQKYHGEIYNDIEQNRLKQDLSKALSLVQTASIVKKALDFGCGAGNLTNHLSELGCDVIAGDVSEGFLDLISSKTYKTNVKTICLNGFDISNIADNSLDMVATYSVLHHVPDYLAILKEFMRILKPGGVVFIDHESSEGFWKKDPVYAAFLDEMKKYTSPDISKYFVINNYYDWLVRRFINPKYHREGDIHVFGDDHIEWDKVEKEFICNQGEIIYSKDYLLYNRKYNESVYNRYINKTSDVRVIFVKKIC